MRKRPWPLLAMLIALAMVAAACGDDATEVTDAADGEAAMDDEMSDDEMSDEMSMSDEEMDDDAMDHDSMDDGEMGHHHGDVIEVPDGMAVPGIEVTAGADTKSGHNVFIELTDFTVTPENASTDPIDGEGHLHLYVDGERVSRFYNTEIHLAGLDPGEHMVEVEVSANNHAPYAVDGDPIRAMTMITVEEAAGHQHGDGELFESAALPTIDVTVTEDPKSGYNVFADISGFTLSAENAGADPVDGEGHLHIYVDGEKVGRLYGPWTHLALKPGSREIAVEINGNDHLAYDDGTGQPLRAVATVEVPEMAMGDDDHDDDHSDDDGDDSSDDSEDAAGHGHSHGGTGERLDMAAADADIVVEASFADGELTVDDRRIEVPEGSTVGIRFESDVDEEMHVHGYDLLAKVGPGMVADLAFLADSPGTFEVELEQSGRFLFEIQVR